MYKREKKGANHGMAILLFPLVAMCFAGLGSAIYQYSGFVAANYCYVSMSLLFLTVTKKSST